MIGVVVGTFGDPEWEDLAHSRALSSLIRQRPDNPFITVHADTLANARNEGAGQLTEHVPWLLFLDADDELAPGYLDAMETAIGQHHPNSAHLYVPQVQYVKGPRYEAPFFPVEMPYTEGNWMVIGTVVPAWLFHEVGGFEEWPIYEDYALFARMQEAGAKPVRVPDAHYQAHVRPKSRNRSSTPGGRAYWHQCIGHAIWPHLYDALTDEENEQRTLLQQGRIRKTTRRLQPVDGS